MQPATGDKGRAIFEWFIYRLVKPTKLGQLPAGFEPARPILDEIKTQVHRSMWMMSLTWALLDEIGRRPFFSHPRARTEMFDLWARLHAPISKMSSEWGSNGFDAELQKVFDSEPDAVALGLKADVVLKGVALHSLSSPILVVGAMRECFHSGRVYVYDAQGVRTVDPLRQPCALGQIYVPMALAMAKLREIVK